MTDSEISQNNNLSNNTYDRENVDAGRRKIENWSVISLICLIAAVLLISFDLRLYAGCFIIAGAAIYVMNLRKYSDLIKRSGESFVNASSSNVQKDDVITGFSHRIREPLNNIVLTTGLLMDTQLQKKQKELMDTLAASVNNMATTVNELTMQSAGMVSFTRRKPIRFNILSAVQNTIEMYRLKPGANLDFIFTKRDYMEFECQGDPVILKQVFLDLFNSIGAMDSGRTLKVTITIRKEKEEGNENFFGFRIQTDTDRMLINEEANSGILASRLISDAKGWFSQEAGDNYSVLNFSLPFTSPAGGTGSAFSATAGNEIRAGKRGKELKEINILMVDDDLLNQKITVLTLKPLVKSIMTAANGNEALKMLASSEYDLILMDIQMPVMNGLTTSERIREIESASGKHIPIIAITANAMIDDIEKCLAAGIDDYISKPCQPAALIGKIRNVVGAEPVS